jgi:Tfp pilus assembly ATPase PilU
MKALIELLEAEGVENAEQITGKIMHLFQTHRDVQIAAAVERYAASCLAVKKVKDEATNGDRDALEVLMNGGAASTIFINMGR